MYLFKLEFSFFLDICPGVIFLDLMATLLLGVLLLLLLLLENLHAVLCGVYTNLHFHQQCRRVPFLHTLF